ncbi:unnamed protein product [Vitrella brassicaformis CCMP3155]|uniref:Uncharacterized protein n=1 Tax=Vitrella brassicaformis (strain CCMP3155) TaxID=1169540 RepID=A0A0G4FJE8_VITBC|nr:unnamed protein product [Vitrella brassicaformis CCMP3155]|eukprot:CEM13746.1 unnamed protein product [Vitrella brassicaformis CCMP3155]
MSRGPGASLSLSDLMSSTNSESLQLRLRLTLTPPPTAPPVTAIAGRAITLHPPPMTTPSKVKDNKKRTAKANNVSASQARLPPKPSKQQFTPYITSPVANTTPKQRPPKPSKPSGQSTGSPSPALPPPRVVQPPPPPVAPPQSAAVIARSDMYVSPYAAVQQVQARPRPSLAPDAVGVAVGAKSTRRESEPITHYPRMEIADAGRPEWPRLELPRVQKKMVSPRYVPWGGDGPIPFSTVRSSYKNSSYSTSISKEPGTYTCVLAAGNNHKLVERVLTETRPWWRVVETTWCSIFDLRWDQTGHAIKWGSISNVQLVNHFEYGYEIAVKGRLLTNLAKFTESLGLDLFEYIPLTFLINSDRDSPTYQDFAHFFNQLKRPAGTKAEPPRGSRASLFTHPNQLVYAVTPYPSCFTYTVRAGFSSGHNLWILKPSGLSRGRGIQLFKRLEELRYHLIEGAKPKPKQMRWVWLDPPSPLSDAKDGNGGCPPASLTAMSTADTLSAGSPFTPFPPSPTAALSPDTPKGTEQTNNNNDKSPPAETETSDAAAARSSDGEPQQQEAHQGQLEATSPTTITSVLFPARPPSPFPPPPPPPPPPALPSKLSRSATVHTVKSTGTAGNASPDICPPSPAIVSARGGRGKGRGREDDSISGLSPNTGEVVSPPFAMIRPSRPSSAWLAAARGREKENGANGGGEKDWSTPCEGENGSQQGRRGYYKVRPPVKPVTEWVAQKYIERSLLIRERKFDVRMWAVVTPSMHVYLYSEGYIRTASEPLRLDGDGYVDPFIHITNNAVQKLGAAYGKHEAGNQMSFQELQEYCAEHYPHLQLDFSPQGGVLRRVSELVALSMQAIRQSLNRRMRRCSFQLFGYDFMIDEGGHTWLIEVNSNPCLEESSPLLRRLLPEMLHDLFKLVVDPYFKPIRSTHWNIYRKFQVEERASRFELVTCLNTPRSVFLPGGELPKWGVGLPRGKGQRLLASASRTLLGITQRAGAGGGMGPISFHPTPWRIIKGTKPPRVDHQCPWCSPIRLLKHTPELPEEGGPAPRPNPSLSPLPLSPPDDLTMPPWLAKQAKDDVQGERGASNGNGGVAEAAKAPYDKNDKARKRAAVNNGRRRRDENGKQEGKRESGGSGIAIHPSWSRPSSSGQSQGRASRQSIHNVSVIKP